MVANKTARFELLCEAARMLPGVTESLVEPIAHILGVECILCETAPDPKNADYQEPVENIQKLLKKLKKEMVALDRRLGLMRIEVLLQETARANYHSMSKVDTMLTEYQSSAREIKKYAKGGGQGGMVSTLVGLPQKRLISFAIYIWFCFSGKFGSGDEDSSSRFAALVVEAATGIERGLNKDTLRGARQLARKRQGAWDVNFNSFSLARKREYLIEQLEESGMSDVEYEVDRPGAKRDNVRQDLRNQLKYIECWMAVRNWRDRAGSGGVRAGERGLRVATPDDLLRAYRLLEREEGT
jgi:hypothetical protein